MDCLGLLIRHFFGRFFDNELVSQHGDMRTNVVQAFGLVATPVPGATPKNPDSGLIA